MVWSAKVENHCVFQLIDSNVELFQLLLIITIIITC